MQLIVEFDCYADMLDVPSIVVEERDSLKRKFLNWLYCPKSHHTYYQYIMDSRGHRTKCLVYGSKEFVDWLNNKILRASDEKAVIAERDIDVDMYQDVPLIFF